MAQFYSSYFEKLYKAPRCSCVSITILIIYILAIIIPFVFVYYTNGKCLPYILKLSFLN